MKRALKNVNRERFCQYVVKGEKPTFAYEKAYPSDKPRKKATLWTKSCLLMQEKDISSRIAYLMEKSAEKTGVTLEAVLGEMAKWLLFDPIILFDENSDSDSTKSIKDLPEEARMSIAELTVQELFEYIPTDGKGGKKVKTKIGEVKKYKFIDKRATADMFMKKFGAYIDRKIIETEGSDLVKEVLDSLKQKK